MPRLLPLLDAKRLAGANAAQLTRMRADQEAASEGAAAAETELNAANELAFDSFLGPFAAEFARIKHVELDDLPIVTVAEFGRIDVEMQKVAVSAVHGLSALAGGGALGAAVGAGTFAAVGAFATASTGAAIGGLSGAAATSATLAWLGGGSLAAGGGGVAAGTAVLATTVAAPLVVIAAGFVHWQGVRAHRKQLDQQEELCVAEAELQVQIDKSRVANRRAADTASVVCRLADAGVTRLPELSEVLARRTTGHSTTMSDDWLRSWSASRRPPPRSLPHRFSARTEMSRDCQPTPSLPPTRWSIAWPHDTQRDHCRPATGADRRRHRRLGRHRVRYGTHA